MLIPEDVISGDNPVLVKLPKGDAKLVRLKAGAQFITEIRLGKVKVPTKALIGQKYGSTFTYSSTSREWTRTQKSELQGVFHESDSESPEPVEESSEMIFSNESAIETMKVDDHLGHSRATESAFKNEAFLSKTKFSQEKYLRKKHEKFAKEITVLKPSLNEFCDLNTVTIRGDLLGSLVRFSGARQGSVVAVVDDGAGILTTALTQRLCEVDRFVFGRNTGQERAQHIFGVEKADNLKVYRNMDEATRFYDSVVVVHNGTAECDLGDIFQKLSPKLKLGGNIAFYCRNIEPLFSILYDLRKSPEDVQANRFINVQLTEQLCREIEIVKDRTHPIMQQSVYLFQGFILSAIKVSNQMAYIE